jgi:hypothetical protein
VRVVVRFLRQPAEDLERWIAAQPGREPERRHLARVAIDALKSRLEEFEGAPPEAVPEPGFSPPVWWWRYYSDLWIQFCVEDVPKGLRRLFRPRTRVISIVRSQQFPPAGVGG